MFLSILIFTILTKPFEKIKIHLQIHLLFRRPWTGTQHLLHQPSHFTYLSGCNIMKGRTRVAFYFVFLLGMGELTPYGQPAAGYSSLVLEPLVKPISTENCPLLLPVIYGIPSPAVRIGQDETGVLQATTCLHLSCQALTGHSD